MPVGAGAMSLIQRFAALDELLVQQQDFWRERPFTRLTLPWEAAHPELAGWLRRRSLEQAEQAHHQPERLAAPEPFASLARQVRELCRLVALPAVAAGHAPAPAAVAVPGRKWQQIEAFAGHLHFTQPPRGWLDWCAGKGHLGRLLAADGRPLTSLERDPQLVAAARQLSRRAAIQAEHRVQDVLADGTQQHLQAQHCAVALHACGDLHVQLIRLATQAGCRQLAIAPCCYNRTLEPHYQPLSSLAQASPLRLSRIDLGLPLTETVTAPARVRRQRDQSMAWRLAFDLLQRELRQQDDYLPVPSLPPDWLQKPFNRYCRDLAELKALPAPLERDWAALEQAGWQRLAQVRNLELVRALFRRPLELWLVLDRALFLEESGYQVRLGEFCARELTPRNLLLLAERVPLP